MQSLPFPAVFVGGEIVDMISNSGPVAKLVLLVLLLEPGTVHPARVASAARRVAIPRPNFACPCDEPIWIPTVYLLLSGIP